jgi:SAM-dependent methyltransferase
MIKWFSSRSKIEAEFNLYHKYEKEFSFYYKDVNEFKGWCSNCEEIKTLSLVKNPNGWTNLREGIFCECGMTSRNRLVFNAFKETNPYGRFLLFERITPFYNEVQRKYPFVEGCEFLGYNFNSGEVKSIGNVEVRNENILKLSYEDESFDFIFHGDVLEHVPDIPIALSECFRILKNQGTLIFTIPFYNNDFHKVRCKMDNGRLVHFDKPEYHGNPLDPNGSLVFYEPGWEILDDLKSAGFLKFEIGYIIDFLQGIIRDGHPNENYNTWPVIFRCKKFIQ